MNARLFNRTTIAGFTLGFVVGFSSGQGEAELEFLNNSTWIRTYGPGIVAMVLVSFGVRRAVGDERADSAISTMIGYGLGFSLGYTSHRHILSLSHTPKLK